MNKKLIAVLLLFSLIPTTALAATPKPTQAQIDAAKKIEAEKKAAADAAAKKLVAEERTRMAQAEALKLREKELDKIKELCATEKC